MTKINFVDRYQLFNVFMKVRGAGHVCFTLTLSLFFLSLFSQQVKGDVIITMEMCDGDLRKLLESKQSFTENDIVDFLHQLGKWPYMLNKWLHKLDARS